MGLGVNPALVQGFSAEAQGSFISGKSLGLASPHLATELIEEEHQCQCTAVVLLPAGQLSALGLLAALTKAVADLGVELRIAPKPLNRPAVDKPERDHLLPARLLADGIGQGLPPGIL